jgi:hypothetical protein
MAEDHVPGLARQFGHAQGHAVKLTTKSPRGRSRCGSQGLSQCQCPAGTSQVPGSGKVTRARPQFLGGFQIAPDLVPAGAVARMYAVRLLQLLPPSLPHGEGVGTRERLPDQHVAVALEALDVG